MSTESFGQVSPEEERGRVLRPMCAAVRARIIEGMGNAARAALAVTSGLVVGALTSFGQSHLDGAPSALVNSASAWLVAPFLVGAAMRSDRGAALAGFTACGLQLVAYAVTSELRGFSYGAAIVAFWAICAVLGGPLFGLAGRLWRTRTGDLRGLGGAALPSAFVAEGLWTYLHELRYYATAALWLAIGTLLAVALTRGLIERRWLPATLMAGLLGEVALTQVYAQAF